MNTPRMSTPIADFVRHYADSNMSRLHMPGHKGRAFLGCEAYDITEIAGADSLYEADGIIAQSEANAAQLFGSRRTLYSTEGSSQCIRAMLYLLIAHSPKPRPLVLAGRNAHKAFLYAAALLDFDVRWLYPTGDSASICACAVSPDELARELNALDAPPAAVYITSPDYLGNQCDIAALAAVCHSHGVPLAVDNAHGAYLRFLSPSQHPLDLGADTCCDSAHKTLPVLTGGAYLHIAHGAPEGLEACARQAMALFGSTSPSYLTLASLDLGNAYLADGYAQRLSETVCRIDALRDALRQNGWTVSNTDPLKLTVDAAASGMTGAQVAQRLRAGGVECEYADGDDVVLMFTPESEPRDYERVAGALGVNDRPLRVRMPLPMLRAEGTMRIRDALFSPQETVPAHEALGRVCGAPTVSCPPAIPIAVSGERIGREAIELFERYGVEQIAVVREQRV